MKKGIIFLLTIALLLSLSSVKVVNANEQLVQRKIEILSFEISLLRSLVRNMLIREAISAHSYIVVRISDGAILLDKNANRAHSIASITKLMSAVVALENVFLNQEIMLTRSMLSPFGHSPSLYLGRVINMENLMRASLIQSVNDAAHALAHFIDERLFIARMNQKARELGMKDTVFYDAHGLSPRNVSTASDLVKLIKYINEHHPQILEITKDNDFWLTDRAGALLRFHNLNSFHPLGSFAGGKTGFLFEARHTFAGIFSLEGEYVITVVLRSNNHQADIFALLRKLPSTQ